ncbi:hypothetical protein P8452_49770 [Trifolium repens]|jgi:hypothetical protein|nr:hypothetical protein QL285_078831 [Trifolium repens]KAK2432097.1 hypothetical protein QL285_030238 [Trifolium repens]WJX59825.1 hypothetical protein P8452_45102 [Trifolium repens]WJX65069.1 hypothetical protein P8452_49770 [Trifolium repens]
MGRQDNDPTMVNSSIALLQERFRQLEKVKERREGKQLLRLLSSESNTSASQQRLVPNNRQTHHDSLSLGLNLTSKQGDMNTMKSSTSLSSWSHGGSSTSRNFDTSDVDTSLHL